MNLKEIKEIVNLMNENDLVEVEVEREGVKLKLKKNSFGIIEPKMPVPVQYTLPEPAQLAGKSPESSAPAQAAPQKATKQIVSPMVGTFYRAPSPEAPPFVDVGQMVEVGQVVCIVEAMKLMNEIKSEVKGKIIEVCVGNAEPVEFGQALFVVEPV